MSENRPQMTVQSAVEVVAAVVDVEQGEKVLRIYREEQAPVDFVCMAHGTARTEMRLFCSDKNSASSSPETAVIS